MSIEVGDMFHYIGAFKLSDEDYVVAIELDDDEREDIVWRLFDVETGTMTMEYADKLLDNSIYKRLV
jgi:hypothetical protein